MKKMKNFEFQVSLHRIPGSEKKGEAGEWRELKKKSELAAHPERERRPKPYFLFLFVFAAHFILFLKS